MLLTILLGVLVVIGGLLLYASTRPDNFQVQRSISIDAPAEKIFPLINNFHQWQQWSPFEAKDLGMKRTFSGAEQGKGAVYAWEGSRVGAGQIEIADGVMPSRVTMTLDMWKPVKGHNIVDFTLQSENDSTVVTWAMRGAATFVSKLMRIFINMEKMCGNDFEVGLAKLKNLAETRS
jgi:uncharacterized protein YndB with AHSA1/START domain